jgi:putative redox protein
MPTPAPDPPPKPPVIAELVLAGPGRYQTRVGDVSLVIGGAGEGPSPVQALVVALAGCMAMDVEEIVRKGRHPLAGLRARIHADRRSAPPAHLTSVALHFVVEGDVPAAAVERAIDLSRERYCSVWHSLRQDIAFQTSFEVTGAGP